MTDRRFAALMMAPAIVFLLAFVAWPIVKLLLDSFHEIQPIGNLREFVGLDNYSAAFRSSAFQGATLRTFFYTVFVVTMEFTIGLGVALMFSALGRRSGILRTIFIYPLMIAPVVAGLLWRFLLIDNFGIVNQILFRVGILSSPADIGWLSDPSIVLLAVTLPDIWLATSFVTLVLYAGLQNIPGDVIEAARLDGASGWSLLVRIVLPLIRPMIGVALVFRGIDAAKAFDIILIQTGGGPQRASETLSLLIYQTSIRYQDPGYASAMSVVFLAAMVLLALMAVRTIWKPGAGS
ncbi:MAG TPA: sugar ABC transporter permease [Actinomycetaceae bacterium]|nr:sugar ABC transporter permease [Actinomycetaceae bacterium]